MSALRAVVRPVRTVSAPVIAQRRLVSHNAHDSHHHEHHESHDTSEYPKEGALFVLKFPGGYHERPLLYGIVCRIQRAIMEEFRSIYCWLRWTSEVHARKCVVWLCMEGYRRCALAHARPSLLCTIAGGMDDN